MAGTRSSNIQGDIYIYMNVCVYIYVYIHIYTEGLG